MSKPFWPMGFGIVLSLAGMCPAQPATSAPAASQPSGIRIESPDYNFGKVWAGESVSHTFKFMCLLIADPSAISYNYSRSL